MGLRKNDAEIALMRKAGKAVAKALKAMGEAIVPNVTTTADLNRIAEQVLAQYGATPAFKGYRGYPAALCASINEEVVHGIPNAVRILAEGDIVGLDIGAVYEGWMADAAWTFAVGETSAENKRLMNVTKESLFQGIAKAKPGNTIGDIANAVQTYVEKHGYSVVRDLSGHGIGQSVHEEPNVPNFGKKGKGMRLQSGMTICIEPMVNAGGYAVVSLKDGWTIVTADKSMSAHYEHTVLVTDNGPVLLTADED